MKDFKFTVILVSYNNFRYIFEALDSIFQQTYSNIQLIISDDCSSDFNRDKVQRYVARHAKCNICDLIINVNKKNLGTVKHLEEMHKLCTGELIIALAADDAFADAQVLERLANAYVQSNKEIKVITSQLAMCGTKLKDRKSLYIAEDDICLINSGDSSRLLEELSYRCIMPSSGTAIAPDVYTQIGTLSDDYKYVEDWNSHLRIVRMGFKIRCLDSVSVLHRAGGISHGAKRVASDAYYYYYEDLLTVFKKEVEPYLNLLSENAARRARQYHQWRIKRYRQDLVSKDEGTAKKKIVFYFRKGIRVKGDFALYYRIAAEISKNEDYAVYCVNNSFPEMQRSYIDSNIRFCDITKQNSHIFRGATFVAAFNHVFYLLEETKKIKDVKLLLLFMHPQTCHWTFAQVNKTFSYNSVLKMLITYNAYAFMDEGVFYSAQKYCSKRFDKRYFPVNTVFNHNIPDRERKEKSDINIVWYGRLDADKLHSLLNFLDNLVEFDIGKPITIHLIGDGNAKDLKCLDKYTTWFRFVIDSSLYGEQRDSYLLENADMVLSMGMPSIDAAGLKLPVVIPIAASGPFKENKFVLFYDSKDYCLGTNSEVMKLAGMKTYPAHKIVQLCCGDQGHEIGEKCYQYAKDNFAIENQMENYMSLISGTTLTIKQFRHNPSVRRHIICFRIYKAFGFGKRDYSSYMDFKGSIRSIKSKAKRFGIKLKGLLKRSSR